MRPGATVRPRLALVTGASGFLGSALCQSWRNQGIQLRALHRPGGSRPAHVDQIIALADDFDEAGIRRALEGVDTVVHLAARVHQLNDRVADPLSAHRRINVEWTRMLAQTAVEQGVGCFVFTSSVKAAGESNSTPWNESMAPEPVDPYGISKLEAEQVLRDLGERSGMAIPVLRLPLSYGPGVKANMLRLFDAVWRRKPLPLGRIENSRSLLFSGNLVAAIDAVAAAGPAASRVFYVSDDRDLSTTELIRLIGDALGVRPRNLPVPPALLRAAGRAGDLLASVTGRFPLTSEAVDRLLGSLRLDVSALRSVTGWSPIATVEAGMAATAQWYLERRKSPGET